MKLFRIDKFAMKKECKLRDLSKTCKFVKSKLECKKSD